MQYSIQSSWINQKENLFVTKTSSVAVFFVCGKGKSSVKLPGCWWDWLESLLLSCFLPDIAPGGCCCLKNSVNSYSYIINSYKL